MTKSEATQLWDIAENAAEKLLDAENRMTSANSEAQYTCGVCWREVGAGEHKRGCVGFALRETRLTLERFQRRLEVEPGIYTS